MIQILKSNLFNWKSRNSHNILFADETR